MTQLAHRTIFILLAVCITITVISRLRRSLVTFINLIVIAIFTVLLLQYGFGVQLIDFPNLLDWGRGLFSQWFSWAGDLEVPPMVQ